VKFFKFFLFGGHIGISDPDPTDLIESGSNLISNRIRIRKIVVGGKSIFSKKDALISYTCDK
jgi:hypothetical protein